MMTRLGTIRGNAIELDQAAPYPDGTSVEVTLSVRDALRGSPAAVLRLVGSLSREEAEIIRSGAAEARSIDGELWDLPSA